MCIPIIYISCVKILRMYSVKNSLTSVVISCFHIRAASAASSTASQLHGGGGEEAENDLPGSTGSPAKTGKVAPLCNAGFWTRRVAAVDGR